MNWSLIYLRNLFNFPNPVSKATTIRYFLPNSTHARIDIITTDGRVVSDYDLGFLNQGQGEFVWRRDVETHASGVYLIRFTTDLGSRVSRMVLQ